MMYGLPSSFSCTMSARMPICAARPLLSSIARLESLVSSSNESQPKSSAPLRKSPTNSLPVPSMSFITASSRKPTNAKICARPAAGTTESAARPVGTSANGRPYASSPGRRMPADVTTWPRTASMQMRPCLISTKRRRSKRSWSAPSSRLSGSMKPSGGCAPSSDSKPIETAERDADGARMAGPLKARAETRIWANMTAEMECVSRAALLRAGTVE
mmetsp:Transcript_21698/g.55860  ORF Transcript_21698/g.55860 Transcript_21698/m.55860 type:complete len:216 (-) Transcript_21698:31-678(-)